jgi:methylated-DNA-protein-cysteine methyltransferase related protein
MDRALSAAEQRIVEVIELLGEGEVVSYGDIAHDAGLPRAARLVGRVCATVEGLPWWRVVNSVGRLVPGNEVEQTRLLRLEGVEVSGDKVRTERFRRSRARGVGR